MAVAVSAYHLDRCYEYLIPEGLREAVQPGRRVIVPFGPGNRRTEGMVLALTDASRSERKLKYIASVPDAEAVLSPEMLRLARWMHERYLCTFYDAVHAILPAGMWYSVESMYSLCAGVEKEAAYAAAGKSGQEKTVLDAVFAHGDSCPLTDLQAVFAPADPSRALASLVKKEILFTDSREKRRVGDKTEQMVTLRLSREEAETLISSCGRAKKRAEVLRLLCDFGSVTLRDLRYFTGCSRQILNPLLRDGVIEITEREIFRTPEITDTEPATLPELNSEQSEVFRRILQHCGDEFSSGLLYGVTGSGKTSVYIRLIDEMLRRGRSAILLVPEISLTPQMIRTFSSHFGKTVAVLHSSLSAGERYDEWKRIRRGSARVVIGTRSAVFAPCERLGLLIIDEEQEYTYKSENEPRYHAREVAAFRCRADGAYMLLGSATPDLGTMYAAKSGRIDFFELRHRYNQQNLPAVSIVDMKQELRSGNESFLSRPLRLELEKNLAAGEQSIFFLNRRGTAGLIHCRECGYTYSCPNCSVSLTWHADRNRLVCHYCGHTERPGESCPDCGGKPVFEQPGTQKLQQELECLYPGVQVLRLDADTVSAAGSHEAILSRFRREKIPILIGTQMVTKGLNFPNVTLVGILSADQALYGGNFRSAERCFSQLTQVIGRSGRGEKPGRAMIQTFSPSNSVILQASVQDYDSFYESELRMRRLQYSPPFADVVSITASGLLEEDVLRCCSGIRALALDELRHRQDFRVLGPAPLPVVKVSGRFRYRVNLCCRCDREVREFLSALLIMTGGDKEFKGVSVYADVNPME